MKSLLLLATLAAALPVGRYRATELVMAIPADAGPIQERFARAVAGKPEWLQKYVAEHPLPPGAPLPWHANFGISEAEYQRLLEAYRQQRPVDGKSFPLRIFAKDGGLGFEAPPPYDYLNPLRVSSKNQARYGELSAEARPVQHQQARFGVWSGLAWQTGEADSLELDLGTLDGSGRRFLHFHRADPRAHQVRELLLWLDRP